MAERAPPPKLALDPRSRGWVLLATLACLVPLLLQLVMPLGPGIGAVAVVVALLVREYEQPLGADVVLDWRATAGIEHELRISRLARWVDEAERDGRRYRLLLPGQPPLGPAQGAQHRHACLRALALMPRVDG